MTRRRALAAVVAALALSTAVASAAPPRAIPDPPPAVASEVVLDLVKGLSQGVIDIRPDPSKKRSRLIPAKLSKSEAIAAARAAPRMDSWLADHVIARIGAVYDSSKGRWTVSFYTRRPDRSERTDAEVLVTDATAQVAEVRIGPQVAWMMARGYTGAFGRGINRPAVWLTLCALFFLPLVRWRRVLSMRTLDLAVLLSFGVSLIWFNRGEIATSVPLQYPPLVYLALRLSWVAMRRGRRPEVRAGDDGEPVRTPSGRPRFAGALPTWALATLLVLTLGLRYGLNAFDSNVIDVGYAGVIGADRIADGQTPYGTFPNDCGRCDTYGPLTYLAYVPFEQAMPWHGRWDDLPAAHGAAALFDIIAVLGMGVLGWLISGYRLAVALALAWAAFPFTAYVLESNSNDSLLAGMLVWGLVLARRPLGRGLMLGLALGSKFAPALLLPLWSRSPFPRSRSRGTWPFLAGLALSVLLTGWVLLLDGLDGVRAFWSRTIGYQTGRDSPFSIWGQHPGLRPVQIAVVACVALAAVAVVRWPRRLDLLQFAALSGALLIGMQLTLTHWFYLYIPWFVPFALLAIVPTWPERRPTEPARSAGEHVEPVTVGAP